MPLRLNSANSSNQAGKASQALIRSFTGRHRPLSATATANLKRLLPQLAIDTAGISPTRQTFLEIGFGNGEHLLQTAQTNPKALCLGAEVFINGIATLVRSLELHNVANVQVWEGDGRKLMAILPPACLDKLFILYPDPWHKKRHHKRRLINKEFLTHCLRVLKPQGTITVATDWQEYAHWMLSCAEGLFKVERLATLPATRYGKKAKTPSVGYRFIKP